MFDVSSLVAYQEAKEALARQRRELSGAGRQGIAMLAAAGIVAGLLVPEVFADGRPNGTVEWLLSVIGLSAGLIAVIAGAVLAGPWTTTDGGRAEQTATQDLRRSGASASPDVDRVIAASLTRARMLGVPRLRRIHWLVMTAASASGVEVLAFVLALALR